jgi:hypothetical protein
MIYEEEFQIDPDFCMKVNEELCTKVVTSMSILYEEYNDNIDSYMLYSIQNKRKRFLKSRGIFTLFMFYILILSVNLERKIREPSVFKSYQSKYMSSCGEFKYIIDEYFIKKTYNNIIPKFLKLIPLFNEGFFFFDVEFVFIYWINRVAYLDEYKELRKLFPIVEYYLSTKSFHDLQLKKKCYDEEEEEKIKKLRFPFTRFMIQMVENEN